ncbi:KH-domain/beta-lactamase-domain protein [Desulfurococcaceae archaeon AG1]|jgi:KH/beta-lactamase-domain protein|nr:KH-domain/beta-lactamase-domain protein [Desulfurococcaceae archaeon AG1]
MVFVRDRLLDEIRKVIMENIPPEAEMRRVEFEGPYLVIYVRNPGFLKSETSAIKNIAKILRKRIIVKVDPQARKKPQEARSKILELVPSEAGVSEKDIEFDEVLGEVVIKAAKPGLVIGAEGENLKRILVETGWRPRVVRKPPIKSGLLEGIINYMMNESDYRLKFLRRASEKIHVDPLFKSDTVRITALGGFMEVGRSAILLETPNSKILLDFGLNPGINTPPNMYPRIDMLNIAPEEIDAVVVTHAHVDHCGLVPFLFKYGYDGPVYTTEATRDLMALMQLDILDVARREGNPIPFTQREVQKMVLHTIPLKYGDTTDIAPDVKITLYNAGHILGSAMVHIYAGNPAGGGINILYSGDIKFQRTRLLERASVEEIPRVDILILESTYGATDLPPRNEAEEKLIEIIKKTIERKGKVLIPTLSVGRAQEIMLVLRSAMMEKKLDEIPVYIEGMIDEVTAIHTAYPELLSRETFALFKSGENPFSYTTFKRVEDRRARSDIVDAPESSVIMATSGMLTGGPAVEYFKLLAGDPRNTMVFVNYQVKGTLGRRIKDGEKEIQLQEEDGRIVTVKVNMEIQSVEGFSGHSDRKQLVRFVESLPTIPKKIILNHGEPSAIASLAKELGKSKDIRVRTADIIMPNVLDTLTFKP